jgi:hypothetical protein
MNRSRGLICTLKTTVTVKRILNRIAKPRRAAAPIQYEISDVGTSRFFSTAEKKMKLGF